ncbi:MAG: hypothetical protein IT162_05870 [Bryobacterales bacterium]|nr:hypothetical protein [Bryobacterales bacterium]
MLVRLIVSLAVGAALLPAQTILPLADVRQGMRGVGRSVFQGEKIEEFQADILGVLRNAGPKQSIILARLSGGPLERTGVMQGMSGSPIYVNGRLIGAVALAFAFSKEPIAGIRPIEEMLAASGGRTLAARMEDLAAPASAAGDTRLVDVATPLSLGGFSAGTLSRFAPQLRALGLEPMQGSLGTGAATQTNARSAAPLEPGSMISVQLVTGDLSVAADGTVTHVDRAAGRVFAFGHRFLAVGPTSLPFTRSEVLTLLPNLNTSFKISSSKEWMGSITGDYSTAITGQIGRQSPMVPVTMAVNSGKQQYRFQIVEDRLLTPFFLQMATFSAIEATERTAGSGTVAVRGELEFAGGARVKVDNIYSADNAAPLPASLAASIPLGYAMQSGYPEYRIRNINLRVDTEEIKRQYYVDQLWTSPAAARPGETVRIHMTLIGPGGEELRHEASWRVPLGAPAGPLQVTVTDALSTNAADYAHILTQPPASSAQVGRLLNGLRPNNIATIRIWRGEAGYLVQGQHLPSPPPSLALLLKRTPTAAVPAASSRLAEFDIAAPGPIGGSRTIQLDIKE